MDAKIIRPKRPRRSWRNAASAVLLRPAVAVPLAALVLWLVRFTVMTLLARALLFCVGFGDLSFSIRQFNMERLVVRQVRLGKPAPVLAVEEAELRFTWRELLRGHVDGLTVRGVRAGATVAGGEVSSPLLRRLQPLFAPRPGRGNARPPGKGGPRITLGAGLLQDVRVDVARADGSPLAALTFEAGALSESAGRYRVWCRLNDDLGDQLRAEGSVEPATGAAALTPELKIASLGKLFELAGQVAPAAAARAAAVPTNGSLTVRGAVAVQGWTNLGPFEVSAELGRGSAWNFPQKDAQVRFRSLRLEASGTPGDVQCRASAGVSGFRANGRAIVSPDEGRMLGATATARFRQTATNQWVTVTLDSDLPGRSLAQVLPEVLPLIRVFFSEGGTLHLGADLRRAPGAQWDGAAAFKAEALRSSVPLPVGRLGAAAVCVSGTVAIAGSKPGLLRTEIGLEEAYYYRRGLSVRGGGAMSLTAEPPYASAAGGFKGRVSESVALPEHHFSFEDGALPFEGEVRVSGLPTNALWQVALRTPEFGVVSTQETAEVRATVGAAADIRYSAASVAVEGDVWARDVSALLGPATNRIGEAGLSRAALHLAVPPFSPACVSNAQALVTAAASNGWARAGALAALEDARLSVPMRGSLGEGLVFLPGQTLTWRRLEAQGLKAVPEDFELSAKGRELKARFGARVAGSKLAMSLEASVPLDDPRQTVIGLAVPEVEIAADDAVAAAVREKGAGAEFSGRVAADAQVVFWGTHPKVTGRVTLADGQVRKDKLSVGGISADVPFQKSASFRTIDRPVVTFNRATVGNVRLEQGRMTFQVTKKEFFVDRMEVGWCKGSLNAYSVHLDFKDPKDDFVVYADRVDLGEALMMVVPFEGMMEGVLYGRIPVGFDKGHVRLSTGFLYSLPGQGGKLKLKDNAQMAALLDKAGIKGEVQMPLSKALSNMDFSTFRMELEPGQAEEGTLRIKLGGKSNDSEWPAPVDLNLNLHGPLEKLLNMGLDVSRK